MAEVEPRISFSQNSFILSILVLNCTTMASLAFFYALASFCILGSILFQFLPDAGSILYVTREHNADCAGCTTKAEWIWILFTSTMLLLPNAWRPFAEESSTIQTMHHDRGRVLMILLVLNLVWFLLPIYRSIQKVEDALHLLSLVGAKAAWPALFNLSLIIFPVKRVPEVLAISHIDMKYCHLWAGYAIAFWVSLHAFLISFVYAINAHSYTEWVYKMFPYRNLYTKGAVNFAGWVGFFFYIALWITSLPWFQNQHFEQCKWLHVLFLVLFIFFSNLHDYNTLYFIQPGFTVYIADLLIRRYSNLTTRVYQNVCQYNRDEAMGDDMKIVFSAAPSS